MLSKTLALSAGLLLCVAAISAQQPTASGDDAAIRDVVKKYVDAREQRDPKAVEALFTADADQLVSSGEWRKGREAVIKGSLASSEQTTGKRTMAVDTVRRVGADAAIADLRYDITQNDGSVRHMWAAWLLVKDGTAWKIAAIRNMLPAAPAGAAAPAK